MADLPADPMALAMVICDQIHRDPMSGKHTILGTFSAIQTRQEFPIRHGPIAVYMALTDGYGKVPIELRVVLASDEEQVLLKAKATVDFTDPRMVAELALGLPPIPFPQPGEYRFQLWAADTSLIIERRVMVLSMTEGEQI